MTGIIAIIITQIIWGAAPPIFKYSLSEIPPFTLAFIRFFVASLIFLPFALIRWKRLTTRELIYIILGCLSGVVINVSAFYVGLKFAPSINVHMISALGPIVLYILSIIVLHEKPHSRILRGMIFAFIGVVIIFVAPIIKNGAFNLDLQSSRFTLIGNFLFVISMIGGVFYALINKKLVKRVDPAVITCLQFFIGSVAFIPMMVYELQTPWSFDLMTKTSWVGIIYGVFFSSALAYFLLNYALKRVSAQELGVYENIKPIIAVIVAIPLLSEYPDIYFLIGSMLTLFGVWISERHAHYKHIHTKIHSKSDL